MKLFGPVEMKLEESFVSLSHVTLHLPAVGREVVKSQKIQYNLAHAFSQTATHTHKPVFVLDSTRTLTPQSRLHTLYQVLVH